MIFISEVDQKKRGRKQCMLVVFSHAHSCAKNNEKNKSGKWNLNVTRKRRFGMGRDMYDVGDANNILFLLKEGCYSSV